MSRHIRNVPCTPVRAPCNFPSPWECYLTQHLHLISRRESLIFPLMLRRDAFLPSRGGNVSVAEGARAADILHRVVRGCYCFDKARRREVNTALRSSMHLRFRQHGGGFSGVFFSPHNCLSLWIPLRYHVSFRRSKAETTRTHFLFLLSPFLRFVELK